MQVSNITGSDPVLTTKIKDMVEIILGTLLVISISMVLFAYWYEELFKKK